MKADSKKTFFIPLQKSSCSNGKETSRTFIPALFKMGFLLQVINGRFGPRKIPETRSCWIQPQVLNPTQCSAFVSTTITLGLESRAHFGCSTHLNSGAECIIYPVDNWLLGHQRQGSKQM